MLDRRTREPQQAFLRSKTEPKRNDVAVVKRSLSPKPSNSRSILKKNLRSNISGNSRQKVKIELSDSNSGDGQNFDFDFQEAPSTDDVKEQIVCENSNDIALSGSGDTEEYEIPDWASKPV